MYYTAMKSELFISVVVPVFKNVDTLSELNSRIFDELNRSFPSTSNFEVIYVVDGSPDNSLDLLSAEQAKFQKNSMKITIIELSQNYGQTAAIIAGIEHSDADACVVISADLQDPPEDIHNLIETWKTGYDIVISTRESRKDSVITVLTSKIAHAVFRLNQPSMPKNGFDFFLISAHAAKHLISIRGRNRFLQGDILSLGFRRKVISHERVERKTGVSSYTFRSRLKLFVDSLFENSRFPITMIFSLGTLISMLGFLLAALSVFNYFLGEAPFSGFVAIFSSILILGGLQIFLLGIMGQFIYRAFEISRGRPLYIVKRIL